MFRGETTSLSHTRSGKIDLLLFIVFCSCRLANLTVYYLGELIVDRGEQLFPRGERLERPDVLVFCQLGTSGLEKKVTVLNFW